MTTEQEIALQLDKLNEKWEEKMNEALIKKEKRADEAINRFKAVARAMQHAAKVSTELLFEYGQHTQECDIWDVRLSGRILDDMDEQEICTCGWARNRDMLVEAKQKGENKELTEKDIDDLLKQYE